MSEDQVAVVLARIEVKLDGALAGVNDHEKRLRRIEERLTRLLAIAGVCGSVAGITAGVLSGVIIR
jgi:hypothetical protein